MPSLAQLVSQFLFLKMHFVSGLVPVVCLECSRAGRAYEHLALVQPKILSALFFKPVLVRRS